VTAPAFQPARAVADLTDGVILAAVEIAAPADRVFRAISSEEIASWWGSPSTYRVTRWTGDVRPGGWWRSEGPWRSEATGAVIHHASGVPHATRAGEAPLLAIYLWSGDLGTHARLSGPG